MAVRVGLDFDGVLADTQGATLELLRHRHGVELTRDDYGWADGWPTIEADVAFDFQAVLEETVPDPYHLADLPPVPGTRDALQHLHEDPRFELVLASHRPPEMHDAIERWLVSHDLPPVEMPDGVPEEKTTLSPTLDVLVDDYHGHADAAASSGALGLHLTAAWESGEPAHPGTVSVPAWDDALDVLLEHAEAPARS